MPLFVGVATPQLQLDDASLSEQLLSAWAFAVGFSTVSCARGWGGPAGAGAQPAEMGARTRQRWAHASRRGILSPFPLRHTAAACH
eukprot:6211241-Pleurochrysis_carterae.AAC.3